MTKTTPQDRLEVNAHPTPQWDCTREAVLANGPQVGLGAGAGHLACALLSSVLNACAQVGAGMRESGGNGLWCFQPRLFGALARALYGP